MFFCPCPIEGMDMKIRRLFPYALLCILVCMTLFAAPYKVAAREVVAFSDHHIRPGTIYISTRERRLYLVMNNGKAIRYKVAVGRAGKSWSGHSRIARKVPYPDWMPPASVKRDFPHLPDLIPGGAANNPMGIAAMTLAGHGGEYAIHGTNRPKSIGRAVSYGCIRMHNRDIADLFQRVRVGTPVLVR